MHEFFGRLEARDVRREAPAVTRSHAANNTPGLITNAGATGYALATVFPRALGPRRLRLRWWNGYTTSAAPPAERPVPNPVTIRTTLLHPAGFWRQINGSTAWDTATAYGGGNMVTHGGKVWLAITNPVAAGTTPAEGTSWTEVRLIPVRWAGADAHGRVTVPGGSTVEGWADVPGLRPGHYLWLGMLSTVETGAASGVSWIPGDVTSGLDFVRHHATLGDVPVPGSGTDPHLAGITNQVTAAAGTGVPLPNLVLGEGADTQAGLLLGDSIMLGESDSRDLAEQFGWAGRAFSGRAWAKVATGGHREDQYLASRAYRDTVAQLADWCVCDYGGGSLVGGTRTLAQIQADLTTLWTHLRQQGITRLWHTTITPATTSTDSWATTANQSAYNASYGASPSAWWQLNAWLRDGAPITTPSGPYKAGQSGHPLTGVLDVATAVTDPTSGWRWIPGMTTDGVHPNAAGHAAMTATAKAWVEKIVDGTGPGGPVTLIDAATIITDDAAGNHYRATIAGNRTLGAPTNPTDGQRALWEITALGSSRTLTLTSGAGGFELTSPITSPITIPAGKTLALGALYSSARARWTVLASATVS